MSKVMMYSRPGCPFCMILEHTLRENGATEVVYLEVKERMEDRDDLFKIAGSRQVPQVMFREVYIGDFDVISAMKYSGKLRELLAVPKEAPESAAA